MPEEIEEDELMRSVAPQNAESIFLARQGADREALEAMDALERKSDKLAQQREWFQVALSSIGDAVITTDVDARVTFLNPVAEKLTGWNSAQAVGQPLEMIFKIINEETGAFVENPVGAVLRKGTVIGLKDHTTLISRDGTRTPIEDSAAPIRDSTGKTTGSVIVFHDVTERRRTERALRDSEEFNRTIIESSRDCTKTLDLNGVLLWMSEAAQKALCTGDPATVIGKSWLEFWQGDDREAAEEAIRKAAGGGSGNFVGCFEIEGQARCWDVVVTPILGRSGRPEKLLVVSRDVTERRKLDEVHARLAAVVEFSDDAIISKTLEGVITTWNKGAERIFGYTAEEAIGKPVTMLIPPDRAAEEPMILHRVKHGEAVLPYETVRVTKSRRRIHVSLTVSPIKNTAGEIIGVSKIARDITRRKQAEAEQARLTSVLEKSLNEIYIFDTTELHFQYVNHGALRNLGYTMEQMQAMTPVDLKPEYTEVQFREMVQPLLQGEQEKLNFYTVHQRADGTLYPVEVHLQCVSHAGEAVFLAVILDITERQKVERDRERLLALEQAARAKAQEAENRARFLAEASANLASTLDLEATLRKVAQAAVPTLADWCSVILRAPSGEARVAALAHVDSAKLEIAETLRERFPESSDSSMGVHAVLRTGRPQLFPDISDETLVALARDEEHLALLRKLGLSSGMIVPIVGSEHTLGAITLFAAESGRHFTEADLPFAEDLAARAATAAENVRLYQELRHANAAKDHFIAVLSHELRTPLNPVLMTVADLEHDETLAPAIREQLTVVRRNIELEARLIDDLLDSTRIANGKLQLHRTVVDATELIRRAVAIVEGDARTKGVHVEVTTCSSPCVVDADPARLQQVIWNLVKNAVKFTPEGGWVRLTSEQAPGRLRVVVEDSGIGIPKEHLGKIFNAFEQGDTGTGHRFGGLGLGLAISQALATLHGGSLTAQSEGPGRGATFILELPLATEDSATISPASPQASPRRALRLLVVEDDVATANVMLRLLTKRGYSVSAATSIAGALEVLEQTQVDLLISDVGLPDGSGRELMEKVRKMQHLPGIALSGYGTEADLAQSSAVGFSVHLTKPVDIERLDRAIQALGLQITS